jgi:hypothetical protein
MLTNVSMHKCLKKQKTEEVQKILQEEAAEEAEIKATVPDFDKGAERVIAKFKEWMLRNDMGAENTITYYVSQVKTFLIHYEDSHPTYMADNLLSLVGTRTLLPMPLKYILLPERTTHSRKNLYCGFQKFSEFISYRFDSIYLIDSKIKNEEKYLFRHNIDSVQARLSQKRKKIFKEAKMSSIKSQSEKMSDEANLKFNTASMVNIIQKFLMSERVQEYMKLFRAVDEKTDSRLKRTTALGTLEVRNLAICLCHIFGGGKRADAYMNMTLSEFDERREVEDSVQISVFKHKTAQSGSALISYEKGSFTDVVMTMYR